MSFSLPAPTESLEATMVSLLPTTLLFKHIERVSIEHFTGGIKFLGKVFEREGERPYEHALAVLLAELDHALFYGNTAKNPLEFDGLMHTPGVTHYQDRESFYSHIARCPKLRLFTPLPAAWVGEGDLAPSIGHTFAVDPARLRWEQPLPCVVIGLVPFREGRPTAGLEPASQPTFQHENSKVRERGCVVLYGRLVVEWPSEVAVLGIRAAVSV